MFKKYARAISSPAERERLRKLYITRNVLFAVCLFVIIVLFVAAFTLDGGENDESFGLAESFFILLLLLSVLAALIAALALQLRFTSSFRRVLNASDIPGESEEVRSYRLKYREASKASLKAMIIPFSIGIVFLAAAVVAMFIAPEENGEGNLTASIGVFLFFIGFAVIFLSVLFREMKLAAAGKSFGQSVGAETAAIDAQQGRPHKYRLEEDAAAQNPAYLFPNEELQAQVVELRKTQVKKTMISMIVGCVIAIALDFVFFSGYIFPEIQLAGYAFPFLVAVITLFTVCGLLPVYVKAAALDKAQYAELQAQPEYEANLRLFELYKNYGRTWGRAPWYFLGLSFIVSLVLAIVFPDELFSLFGFLPIVVMLIVSVQTTKALRLKAKPIEAEIDARNAAKAADEASAAEAAANDESQNDTIGQNDGRND